MKQWDNNKIFVFVCAVFYFKQWFVPLTLILYFSLFWFMITLPAFVLFWVHFLRTRGGWREDARYRPSLIFHLFELVSDFGFCVNKSPLTLACCQVCCVLFQQSVCSAALRFSWDVSGVLFLWGVYVLSSHVFYGLVACCVVRHSFVQFVMYSAHFQSHIMMHWHGHICMLMCMHTHTRTHRHNTHTHIHIRMHLSTHTHIRMHIITQTHTHTHSLSLSLSLSLTHTHTHTPISAVYFLFMSLKSLSLGCCLEKFMHVLHKPCMISFCLFIYLLFIYLFISTHMQTLLVFWLWGCIWSFVGKQKKMFNFPKRNKWRCTSESTLQKTVYMWTEMLQT